MASVTKIIRKGMELCRAIDFKNHRDEKKRLNLGQVSDENAVGVCKFVEKLLIAKKINQGFEPKTIEWLAGIGDDLYEKLAHYELVKSRNPTHAVPTVCEWLDKYIGQRRRELACGTIERLERTAKRLKAFFQSNPRIDEMTPENAADWRGNAGRNETEKEGQTGR